MVHSMVQAYGNQMEEVGSELDSLTSLMNNEDYLRDVSIDREAILQLLTELR